MGRTSTCYSGSAGLGRYMWVGLVHVIGSAGLGRYMWVGLVHVILGLLG